MQMHDSLTTERTCRGTAIGVTALVALVLVRVAGAQVTGSYDGTLDVKKSGERGVVSVGLIQTDSAVSGTVSLSVSDTASSGFYWVTGKIKGKGKKVKLTGTNSAGATLKWKGKISGDVIRGKAKVKGPGGKMKGMLDISRRGDGIVPDICESPFFDGQVMGRVLVPICSNCHVPGGAAQETTFRVVTTDSLATQQSMSAHIDASDPMGSRILQKPTMQIPHGGGLQLNPGSDEEGIMEQWVQLVADGEQCSGDGPTGDVTLVPMDPAMLLLRAAMDVRGTRPTTAELDRIEADPGSYDSIIDGYLHTPEFLERVKDAFDEALLVRREDFDDESRTETDAIYGEATELVAYIVDNDRPLTELGTADYTVANELFQRDVERMPFPMEPVVGTDWQVTHYLDGRPHAGLLSTSAFYEVWDTNNTNVNRRRANRWSIVFHCYNFLDTPVDVTRDVDNADGNAVLDAVTTRTDCKACHDRLDPMASFLFPMDDADGLEGGDPDDFFRGNPERWRTANRRPPAVYGSPGLDIRDMGRMLTEDPRFAECQTRRAFEMLFLRKPETNLEIATAADLAEQFRTTDGHNFRTLVKRWMTSDAYTRRPQDHDPRWVRRASPERLERLIQDLTGFVWTRDPEDDQDDADPESDPPRIEPIPLLSTEEDGYKVILGGINGETVTGRSHSLNAPVVVVHRKVASLAAADVVQRELLDGEDRSLLTGVLGAEDPDVDGDAIRAHLVRIARRLYGVRYAQDAPEIDNWVNLYRNLYRDHTQSSDPGEGGVPGTQSERAWRGTLTAMLRSPRILIY